METTQSRYDACVAILAARGQEHLLRWWDEMDDPARENLLGEIESIPWEHLDPLIETHVRSAPNDPTPSNLEPPPVFPQRPNDGDEDLYRDAVVCGEELIRTGKVAAVTVAGGQGTRLGIDGPKGMVAVSPVRKKSLFQLFAESILATRKRFEADLPWYIMTSPANHQQTVAYLSENDHFGLPADDVLLFSQGMLPSFGFDGRILMADKHRLTLAPDGHGGSLKALVASGSLQEMQSRGTEVISCFQVDNPLVRPIDPMFIGLHAKTGSEMSTKVAAKADDLERVGNICLHNGCMKVIEYSDFPEELARARNDDGSRRFDVGNLAIHLLNVSFVDRVIAQQFKLPYRRAVKTESCLDAKGDVQTPSEPNAVKLETFVFDALPLATNPMLLEVDRAEEFSPVKNPTGVDSIESAVRHQVQRAVRWLEEAGVDVPHQPNGEPDLTVEIAPSFAIDAADVKRRLTQPPKLHRQEQLYIS